MTSAPQEDPVAKDESAPEPSVIVPGDYPELPKQDVHGAESVSSLLDNQPFFQLLQVVTDATLVTDDQSRCMMANSAACELLGIRQETVSKHRLQELIPEVDVEGLLQRISQDVEERFEAALVGKNGSVHQVIGRLVPHIIPHHHLWVLHDVAEPRSPAEAPEEPLVAQVNPITGLTGSRVNATDHQPVEKALAYQEQLLNFFCSQSLDGVFFLMLDEPVEWNDSVNQEAVLEYLFAHERVTYINDAMLTQYGATREQFLGQTLADFFTHDPAYGRSIVRQTLDRGHLRVETEERKFDGTPFFTDGYYVCIYDDDGRITGHFGVQHDITERKRAELVLKESETRFMELSEASPANIYILVRRVDGSCYFEHVSRVAESILEIPIEQVLADANCALDQIHPEDRAEYEAVSRHSEETLQPFFHQWRMITPSGAIKWLQGSSRPKVRDNGEVAWYGVVLEITDRKRAELALEREIKRRQTLVDASFDGIVVVDAQGNVVEANQSFAAMLGYSLEEVSSLNVSDWDAQLTPEELAECQQSTAPTSTFETRHRHKEGHVIDVEICCNRVEWEGEVLRFCVCRNISDRKHLEAQLRQREAFLGSIFNGVEVAISVVDVEADHTFRFVGFNPACGRLSGVDAATFRGKTLAELAPFMSADHLANLHATYQRCVATGETLQHEFAIQVDGLDQWWLTCQTPLTDATGQVNRVVNTSIPITERKFAETQLEIQNAILAQIAIGEPLDTILQTMVVRLEQWWPQTLGTIMQLDPTNRLHYRAYQRLSEAYRTATDGLTLDDQRAAWSLAIRLKHQVIVENIAEDHHWQPMQALALQAGLRACWAAPILSRNERVLGLFILYQSEVRSPQANEICVMEQFANLARLAIEHHQAEVALQQQAQRERTLNEVVTAIRSSLDLETIFNLAVTRIAELFQSEVSIVQYLPDLQCWRHRVADNRGYPLSQKSMVDISDVDNPFAEQLKQLQTVIVNDTDVIQDPINQELAQSTPGIWLLMPIHINHQIWGSLSLSRARPTPPWQTDEIDLATRVADQLAIAIQQAKLYKQVQQLNTNLEHQVQERTADLQQALEFEQLLRRITDQVRDSLDENQMLATVVWELAEGLQLACCDTGIYNTDGTTSTIAYEYVSSLQPALGHTFVIKDTPYTHVYTALFQGQACQFCNIVPNLLRPDLQNMTILACPIRDERDTLGDIWLFKEADDLFSPSEVRLAQQVTNQCAIALRQSRLYQAAQAQVQELERLNQLKDDFLSTVSHELRTPMSNIKMAIQLLEIHLNHVDLLKEEQAPVARYFNVLREEGQREINLINDLLDLTRLDAETEPMEAVSIFLQSYVPHVAELFIERIDQQQQHLVLQIPSDLPLLTTHLPYVERILIELLNNACKYTPAGETITVSAQATATGIELECSNSGVEIPPNERDRIFDKFYRIPSHDPWKHGGTGLGLALVYRMVKRLGGAIAVVNPAQPGTTTFRVHLPITLPTSVDM